MLNSLRLYDWSTIEQFLTEEVRATSAMHETERKTLHEFMCQVPHGGTVVEVGCQMGCSTAIIMSSAYLRGLHTIHVDPYTQQPEYLKAWLESQFTIVGDWDHRFTLLCGRTEQMEWELNRLLRDGVHLAFIDGDHEERGVAIDLRVVATRIKPGGLLIAHDYTEQQFPGVAAAIDPFVNDGCWVKVTQAHSMGVWRRR